MSQISQNSDGTYTKTYSDTELAIIRALQDEIEARIDGDQQLWSHITTFQNTVDALENGSEDLASLQAAITDNTLRLDDHEGRISVLETSVIKESYSKTEADAYMVEYRIEQIPHVFETPTNEMFDKANIDDILVGSKHYLMADINEEKGYQIPENTMQRYTINAYVKEPKETTLNIRFADRLVVLVDDVVKATYIDSEGNFEGTAKVLTTPLKKGWTKIQFLLANEVQGGGLVVSSDLYAKSDYLSNLGYLAGTITGERIQAGTIGSEHLSPNMDMVVRTLHATAGDVPGVVIGDANGCGSIQIADKTISKCKDEPFVFDDGIRVNGYIRVSQLLIDVDFIRAGKGIMIDAIKDADTGLTKIYEIINDMLLINGGGLILTGNAQDGYTISNDVQIMGNSGGGIKVTGDAVNGYVVTNIMELTDLGGVAITGDATSGYQIRNTMSLGALKGLKVEGTAWDGYTLKNQMMMTGDGVILTPSIIDKDAYHSWHIENDTIIDQLNGVRVEEIGPEAGHFEIANTMELTGERIIVNPDGNSTDGYRGWTIINDTKLDEGCAIDITKLDNGHFKIDNALSLTHQDSLGPVLVTGDPCVGFELDASWPTINDGLGISVSDNGRGTYEIGNTGILDVSAGTGIQVSSGQYPVISNTGILDISAGAGIQVSSGQYPSVSNTGVLSVNSQNGNISVQAGAGISVTTIGNTIMITNTDGGSDVSIPEPTADTYVGAIDVDRYRDFTFPGEGYRRLETGATMSQRIVAVVAGNVGNIKKKLRITVRGCGITASETIDFFTVGAPSAASTNVHGVWQNSDALVPTSQLIVDLSSLPAGSRYAFRLDATTYNDQDCIYKIRSVQWTD